MSVEIRFVEPAEFADWSAAMAAVFLMPAPNEAEVELRRPYADLTRTRGAWDGDRVVATCRSFATTLSVPGGDAVPADALSNVTVLPTHRRRGLLTSLMQQNLSDAVERGEVVSALVAAEWPIYGRYGYGPAVEQAAYEVEARAVRFLAADSPGEVVVVDPKDARKSTQAVYEAVRLRCPGSIERPAYNFDRELGLVSPEIRNTWSGNVALHLDPDGTVDGFVRWTGEASWDGMRPQGKLVVDELLAQTPDAYAALWRLVCSVDLVTTVTAGSRPVVEPLPHLLADGRAVRQVRREDLLWARVLDVPAALAARRYPVEGRGVVEVVDAQGWAGGVFAVEGGPAGATCVRTSASPEVTVPVPALGACYLGGTRLRTLASAGLVDEHTSGAVSRLDVLLGPVEVPWALTFF